MQVNFWHETCLQIDLCNNLCDFLWLGLPRGTSCNACCTFGFFLSLQALFPSCELGRAWNSLIYTWRIPYHKPVSCWQAFVFWPPCFRVSEGETRQGEEKLGQTIGRQGQEVQVGHLWQHAYSSCRWCCGSHSVTNSQLIAFFFFL